MDVLIISCQISLRCMPQGFVDDKLTSVQVMTWYYEAPSHDQINVDQVARCHMTVLYLNELVYLTIQPWVIVFKENFENITSCIAKWNIVDDFTSIFLNCGELSFNIVAWWGVVSDMPPIV